MMRILKYNLPISIPLKVVILTGATYALLWGVGLILEKTGLVNFSDTIFGVEVGFVFAVVEALFVASAAALGLHLFIERPLARLTRAMSRAEGGDFLIRAPVGANDELGKLARTFNRMLTHLTDLAANNIQTEGDLMMAEEQLKFRQSIEEKNQIIERTNRMLEKLVRDLSLIYEIGQEVGSIADLNTLYAKITETLNRYLRLHEFAILIFDDMKEELHVKAAYGFRDAEAILRTTFRVGEGITGLVAQTGKKVYVSDTNREERFLHYKGERPAETSSFLSIPLIYKGNCLGVINFARRGVSSFSYQDVKMMSLVAGQVAIAIANAHLYTRTRELSVRDELTGINNRRHFQQMLQMEWKRAARFRHHLSIILIDVDHFKEYNDTYGHLQGDIVLKQIGLVLKKNLREVDTVARFGGEEFVLLLPDTDKRGAIAVAEKVRALVEAHRFTTGNNIQTRRITISAGIATYPDDVVEMDDLIDHADIALYRAKANGRNQTECYTPLAEGERETILPINLAKHRREKKKPEALQ